MKAYSHNIVKLDEETLNEKNYIHANILQDPFDEHKKMILTQGPLSNTVHDFWKMIEKFKTRVIVAICEREVLGKKCEKYWTDD